MTHATPTDRIRPHHIRIFDTSLRDGEQSPGFTMSGAQKIAFAHALADLGVDVIEAGFPNSSPADFAAVQAIAREVRGASIATLARCHPGDIEACARGYSPGWVSHKYREMFDVWPRGMKAVEAAPTAELMGWLKSRQIAAAKAREKAQEGRQHG